MNKVEKINYLRLALQMQDIGCSNKLADQILETVDVLNKNKGKFSILDAVKIQASINKKYEPVPDESFSDLEEIENCREQS